MVRHIGIKPISYACKTYVLSLDEWRFKMVEMAGVEPASTTGASASLYNHIWHLLSAD